MKSKSKSNYFLVILLVSVAILSCNKKSKKIESSTTKIIQTKNNSTPFEKQMKAGKSIYTKMCAVCHLPNGKGIQGAFPPVAHSDYLNADTERAIGILLKGKTGKITVNGVIYNSAMSPQPLSSEETANVLTYMYNSWGNNKTVVTTLAVDAYKAK